jgi:hypothetical protein
MMIKSTFGVMTCVFFLFTALAVAQNSPGGNTDAPGCGESKIKFAVETDKEKHTPQPEATKALVYFIEDDSNFGSTPKPTTKIGIDGEWVGAIHGNSYFYVSVDPGVRHLCASWQSIVLLGRGRRSAAAHFTAEAGGVYYFEVKNSYWLEQGTLDMTFGPLDSDQGQLLANKFSYSVSHPKK